VYPPTVLLNARAVGSGCCSGASIWDSSIKKHEHIPTLCMAYQFSVEYPSYFLFYSFPGLSLNLNRKIRQTNNHLGYIFFFSYREQYIYFVQDLAWIIVLVNITTTNSCRLLIPNNYID
jgi:hypothetical protein